MRYKAGLHQSNVLENETSVQTDMSKDENNILRDVHSENQSTELLWISVSEQDDGAMASSYSVLTVLLFDNQVLEVYWNCVVACRQN